MPAEGDPQLASPITADGEDPARPPEPGVALCLSGGGYRAMLFHVGALWRLNELGRLPELDRISSVSGGSITAAALGHVWDGLDFDGAGVAQAFVPRVVAPLRALASHTIDVGSVLRGILTPRRTVAEQVAAAYRDRLFGAATLQDLPDRPRFVINATNVQTGSLWRFSKPYMADYRIGMYPKPQVELAVAVGASSAFPPVLSPVRLPVDAAGWQADGRGPLCTPPYCSDVVLSDGGVYDNLGLQTAWGRYQCILVSDGGGQMRPAEAVHSDWARHAMRITEVIDNQVRSLRKQQTIGGYERKERDGAYWGIRSDVGNFPAPGTLACPAEQTQALAATPTRLAKLPDALQERLVNWGYAACDAAMRAHVVTGAAAPQGFPYPGGVG
jgi:NTE family protein